MKKRKLKVRQISSSIDNVGKYLVLAVCTDGSVWQLCNLYCEKGLEPYWEPFPQPGYRRKKK